MAREGRESRGPVGGASAAVSLDTRGDVLRAADIVLIFHETQDVQERPARARGDPELGVPGRLGIVAIEVRGGGVPESRLVLELVVLLLDDPVRGSARGAQQGVEFWRLGETLRLPSWRARRARRCRRAMNSSRDLGLMRMLPSHRCFVM